MKRILAGILTAFFCASTLIFTPASTMAAPSGKAAEKARVAMFSDGRSDGGWNGVSCDGTGNQHLMGYYTSGGGFSANHRRIQNLDITGMTYLEFDFYAQDADFFSGGAGSMIRFTSSGDMYSNAMDFQEHVLKGITLNANAWTHVKLPISSAAMSDPAMNLAAVNYFYITASKTPGNGVENGGGIDRMYAIKNIMFTDGNELPDITYPELGSGLSFDTSYRGASWRMESGKLATTQHIPSLFETTAADIGDFELTFKIKMNPEGWTYNVGTSSGLFVALPNGDRLQMRTEETAPDLVMYYAGGGYDVSNQQFENNREYSIRVRQSNGRIDVYVDNQSCIWYSAASTPGKLKFEASYTAMTLDDLRIVRLNADGAEEAVVYENNFDTVIPVPTGLAEMYNVYTNHMVLQQGKPIKVAGTALAGHTVKVQLKNGADVVAEQSVTAGDDETWAVALDAMEGGYTAYTLEVYDNDALTDWCEDVLIGEVWLASGQSNMQHKLWQTPDGWEMLKNNAGNEHVRVLHMPAIPAGDGSTSADLPSGPATNVRDCAWYCGDNSGDIRNVSAIAYFFADKLNAELDVPVGVCDASLGATPIYAWISREAIDSDADVKAYLQATNRYVTAGNWNTAGANNYRQMSGMYNLKIAPLTSFNISGTLWYQGEDQCSEETGRYRKALNLLLADYSEAFGFADSAMPLIYSHIAPYNYTMDLAQLGFFAEEMANATLDHPNNMAQVPIYDLPLEYNYGEFATGTPADGELWDAPSNPIHPTTMKKDIGDRFAQAALGMVYDDSEEYTSPIFKSSRVEGNAIYVTFDHVGDGLAAKLPLSAPNSYDPAKTELKGFAICDASGVYVNARAEIVGTDTVKIWNDSIKAPVSATYAYTQMNMSSNLVSTKAGQTLFAAAPFCTNKVDNAQYYHPRDWDNGDLPEIWHGSAHSNTPSAGFVDAWQGISSNVTHDTENKVTGNASVKVEYTADANKQFGAKPVVIDPQTSAVLADIDTDYAHFRNVTFQVKNGGSRSITFLGMQFKGRDGSWYTPCVQGTGSPAFHLAAGDWKTIVLDFTKLVKVGGDATIYPASVLADVQDIQLLFADEAAGQTGIVYLDDFQFGVNAIDGYTPPCAHAFGEWSKDADNHSRTCAICGLVETAAHTFGDWKVTKEATETEKGSKERVCSVCGYKETAEIPVLGHTHEYGEEYKSDAENHWKVCACGEIGDKAAHTFGDWKVTKEATETEKGSKERACPVCGYKETAEIPATGKQEKPETGDSSMPIVCASVLAVSCAGALLLGARRKSESDENG